MSDRELLELAAKAAGLKARYFEEYGPGLKLFGIDQPSNPLVDDGDALRLAIQLRIYFRVFKGIFTSPDYVEACHGKYIEVREIVGDDPCAATRRAIVRAAAEIGKVRK